LSPSHLELKLHVEFDGVTAKPDVVRWIGFVSKCQLEQKLLSVDAGVWVAEDLRTRVGLPLSYDAIASE
jgi:hypothetical protein